MNTDFEPEICDDPGYKALTNASKACKPKGHSINYSDVNEIIDVGDDYNAESNIDSESDREALHY